MRKFKIGDKVYIDPNGNFTDQILDTQGTIGTIIPDDEEDDEWHYVRFENGFTEYYRDCDLIPAAKTLKQLVGKI